MTDPSAQLRERATSTDEHGASLRRGLPACGMAGAALYPLADIIAATRYPGFSYRDQAVSELFAIGAPTSRLVVLLFSVSSALLLHFAIGIWMSGEGRRLVRAMAVMMALNAVDALVLWNFFPMHVRGSPPSRAASIVARVNITRGSEFHGIRRQSPVSVTRREAAAL